MENTNSSAVAETPEGCSPNGTAAANGCEGALSKEDDSSADATPEGGSGVAGGAAVSEGEAGTREREIHRRGRASREDVEGQVTLSLEQSPARSQSLSAGKTRTTRVTLGDIPVITDVNADDSKAADRQRAEEEVLPRASSLGDNREKRTIAEKLRFRSTLATVISDREGMYGEWRAKEEAATTAAKELLQILADRVENLLNEATAVTGRLTQRKNTLREEELRRRASSKKISSSHFPSYEQDGGPVDKTQGCERGEEDETENQSDFKGALDNQTMRGTVAGESDITVVKGVAVEAVESLLKAINHRLSTSESHRHEGGQEEVSDCNGGNQQSSATEQRSSSFEESRHHTISRFSRSSLESYDPTNFPDDYLIHRPQENQAPAAGTRKQGAGTSACVAKEAEDPQLRRDKLWKIFGRETQAGKARCFPLESPATLQNAFFYEKKSRLLYQLYKPAESGGDIVYPIPKSIKDLRGNPHFRVLSPASSSSLAAAAGRHPKRRQVKVAVPRVGRHAARAAAASSSSTSGNRKFEKGNFLSGRGPGGKRSLQQIAKETENRRQQILDEASAHGVAAAAVGLKRDREKALLLQKLPYSACSLLPEAASLPPLSARDRAVFFTEKVAEDRASLYSARSPSPRLTCNNNNNNNNDETSNRSSSKRSTSTHTSKYCSSSPRSNSVVRCRRGNKWETSLGLGTVDPCVQMLIPYVAPAKQRYRKQGAIDTKTGMTEEQKHLFVQTLREIQLRKQKLQNLQKALPDHVLAASLGPLEQSAPASSTSGVGNSSTRPNSSKRGKSVPQSGADMARTQANLFTACFSPDVAKSRLAQRTILQQLHDETKLKREIQERMKELETLISISDTQQRELRQEQHEETQRLRC